MSETSSTSPVEHVGPITSWQVAAEVLGVSYVTLWRRRKAKGDPPDRVAWWEDAKELREWWRALIAPAARPSAPARKDPKQGRTLSGPLDVSAKIRARRER
jgi:hypothetical protein